MGGGGEEKEAEMCLISQRQLQSFRRRSKGRLWFMLRVWMSCYLTCGGETEQVCVRVWEKARQGKKWGDPSDSSKQCWQKVCIIYSTGTAGTLFDTNGNVSQRKLFFFFFFITQPQMFPFKTNAGLGHTKMFACRQKIYSVSHNIPSVKHLVI